MQHREFCFWLQGLFEIGDPKELNTAQVEMIKRHLALTFQNVTAPGNVDPINPGPLSWDPRLGVGIGTSILPNAIAYC